MPTRDINNTSEKKNIVEEATMGDKSSWDTFTKWLFSCSILFASGINSPIALAPNSMLYWYCGLCSLRNRKINIVWGGGGGEGGKCFQDTQKLSFAAKYLNTLVTHCR